MMFTFREYLLAEANKENDTKAIDQNKENDIPADIKKSEKVTEKSE